MVDESVDEDCVEDDRVEVEAEEVDDKGDGVEKKVEVGVDSLCC